MNHEATVRRFVDEAVNGENEDLIDELFTSDMADWAREWFDSFRRSFPDVHMKLVELVVDGDTVVGRFQCSATHEGEWRGHPAAGRRFENVDEVYFFGFEGARTARLGASRTRSTGSSNSSSTQQSAGEWLSLAWRWQRER